MKRLPKEANAEMIDVLVKYLELYENTGATHDYGICFAAKGFAGMSAFGGGWYIHVYKAISAVIRRIDEDTSAYLSIKTGPTQKRFDFCRAYIAALRNKGVYFRRDKKGNLLLSADRSVPGARAARDKVFKIANTPD